MMPNVPSGKKATSPHHQYQSETTLLEEKLRESKDWGKWQEYINYANDLIFLHREKGNIIKVSSTAKEVIPNFVKKGSPTDDYILNAVITIAHEGSVAEWQMGTISGSAFFSVVAALLAVKLKLAKAVELEKILVKLKQEKKSPKNPEEYKTEFLKEYDDQVMHYTHIALSRLASSPPGTGQRHFAPFRKSNPIADLIDFLLQYFTEEYHNYKKDKLPELMKLYGFASLAYVEVGNVAQAKKYYIDEQICKIEVFKIENSPIRNRVWHWFYGQVSDYGTSFRKLAITTLLVWLFFALLYFFSLASPPFHLQFLSQLFIIQELPSTSYDDTWIKYIEDFLNSIAISLSLLAPSISPLKFSPGNLFTYITFLVEKSLGIALFATLLVTIRDKIKLRF